VQRRALARPGGRQHWRPPGAGRDPITSIYCASGLRLLTFTPQAKSPAGGPGFFWNGERAVLRSEFSQKRRSGAGLNSLVALALMGSTVSVRNPLGQFGEFLGVRRQGLELFAGMGSPQLHASRAISRRTGIARSRGSRWCWPSSARSAWRSIRMRLAGGREHASMVPLWLSATSLNLA